MVCVHKNNIACVPDQPIYKKLELVQKVYDPVHFILPNHPRNKQNLNYCKNKNTTFCFEKNLNLNLGQNPRQKGCHVRDPRKKCKA